MFQLQVTLSDGFTFKLDGSFASQREADRAAGNYIRDYRDPCGVGARVSYVVTIREDQSESLTINGFQFPLTRTAA
jgi:hypothetical protein